MGFIPSLRQPRLPLICKARLSSTVRRYPRTALHETALHRIALHEPTRRQAFLSTTTRATNLANRPVVSQKKPVYPEKLVVYHAGAGKTAFLACLKVTTILSLTFFGCVVTPAYISSGEPLWKAAGVALCGIVPFCYVAYATSPFVAHVHLRLPLFARQSREILQRFVKNPPSETRIDITTISIIGKPRVSEMTIADLRPAKERLGLVNYVRDTKLIDARRKWYAYRAVGKFHIQQNPGKIREAWVWSDIAAAISRRAQQDGSSTVR